MAQTSEIRSLLITGTSSFLGRLLCEAFKDHYRLHIQGASNNGINQLSKGNVIDGIISLAGSRVESNRWTIKRKKKLLAHRITEIESLLDFVEELEQKPKVLIIESSTDYYGHRRDKRIFECATRQPIFLSQLYAQWEDCTTRAKAMGIRVVQMRIGKVLSNKGGPLPPLTRFLKCGLGLKYDGGHHWVPWIHDQDLIRLFELALSNQRVSGPMNACSAHPVTQMDFMRILSSYFPPNITASIPGFVVNGLVGEKSQLLTVGQRALPGEALKHGFVFEFKHLQAALDDLNRPKAKLATQKDSTRLLQTDVPPPKAAVKP